MKYELTCRDGSKLYMDAVEGADPMSEVQRWATPPDVVQIIPVEAFPVFEPSPAVTVASVPADLSSDVKQIIIGLTAALEIEKINNGTLSVRLSRLEEQMTGLLHTVAHA